MESFLRLFNFIYNIFNKVLFKFTLDRIKTTKNILTNKFESLMAKVNYESNQTAQSTNSSWERIF